MKSTREAYSYITPDKKVRVAELRCTIAREVSMGLEVDFRRPSDLVTAFRNITATAAWFDPMKECVIVFLFNIRGRFFGYNLVSIGTATQALLDASEVFRPANCYSASGIVVLHNHPSGISSPGVADIHATNRLLAASEVLNIKLIDHVIVGDQIHDEKMNSYLSFREEGLI